MDEPFDLQELTAESLQLLTPFKDELSHWYSSLLAFAEAGHGEHLRVGVIGVTSSGKSTFVNALLGEELLPEQSKTTTNVPVICRTSHERKLTVTLLDGSTRENWGEDVCSSLLKALCSEDGNVGNILRIRNILLQLPGCCLGPGFEIIDTPGVDAFDGERHEEITLYECVPSLDIVIYMTHIVRPFAESDIKLIKRVLEHDQRVLFVISHKDIEKDDSEKGVLYRSKEQKLSNHVAELRKKLTRFPELASARIVTVSSRHGKAAGGDHSSQDWQDSNIGAVLESLRDLAVELSGTTERVRAERLRKILSEFLATAGEHAPNLETNAGKEAEAEGWLARDLEILTTARDAVLKQIVGIRIAAASTLAKQAVVAELHALIAHLNSTDISGFYSAMSSAGQKWGDRQRKIILAIDDARAGCRQELDKVGVPAGRSPVKHKYETGEFPSLDRRIESNPETHTVRRRRRGFFGSIADFFDDGRKETYTTITRSVDVSRLKGDLEAYVSTSVLVFSTFVESQLALFSELYLKPLEDRVRDQKMMLSGRQDLRALAEAKKSEFPRIVQRFQEMVTLLEARIRSYPALSPKSTPSEADLQEAPSPGAASRAAVQPNNAALNMMSSLLARVREGTAISRFWDLAAATARQETPARMLITGMCTEDAGKFIAYLKRSMRKEEPRWSTASNGVGETTITHRLGRTFIAVAPNDAEYAEGVLRDQCVQASLIALQFDGAQPSTGLKRLLTWEKYSLLSGFAPKVLMTFPGAATYDHRLSDLVMEAVAMLRSTAFSPDRCYIYEAGRYDARYTDFCEIVGRTLRSGGSSVAVKREWSAKKLAWRPPFTEAEIGSVYEEIFRRGGKHEQ